MSVLNAMRYIEQQGDEGRRLGKQNAFARVSRDAYSAAPDARNAFVQEAIGIDPEAGFALGERIDKRQSTEATKLAGMAKYMLGAFASKNPAQIQGSYRAVRPFLQRIAPEVTLPDAADESMVPMLHQVIAAGEGVSASTGMPSGFREFEMTARAAGLVPGTPEYKQAANIALGREGRAATGGYSFDTIEWNGEKVPTRRNPRDGSQELWDGRQWVALGAAAPMAASTAPPPQTPASNPAPGTLTASDMKYATEDGQPIPAEDMQFVQAAFLADGRGEDFNVPVTGPAPSVPTTRPPADGPRIGVGRTPEAQAALTTRATEQAKIDAEIGAYERMTGLEVDRTRQVESAKAEVDVNRDAQMKSTERMAALRSELPALQATQKSLLEAYRGFQSGRFKSGALVGSVPGALQSPDNQYLVTTINDSILATAERMKGTLSDKDVAFLKSATFDLSKDERANMLIIGRKLEIINNAVKRAQGAASKPAQSGGVDDLLSKYGVR